MPADAANVSPIHTENSLEQFPNIPARPLQRKEVPHEPTRQDTRRLGTAISALGPSPNSIQAPREIAGFLYLLVAIFGGFAEGFLEPAMYVPGDAAATTENLVGNAGLVSLGVVSDFVNQALLVFLGLTLRPAGACPSRRRRALLVLVTIAAGITSLNVVFEFAGYKWRPAQWTCHHSVRGSNGIVLLLLDTQHYGCSSRRSSSVYGWSRWAISPTSPAGSPSAWLRYLLSPPAVTWWTC